MKTKTFIQLFIFGVLSVVLSACVPKSTENKATCGTNQSFNTVTRSCYSIVEPRTKPVATLSTGSLGQETAKTFTLTYTDTNKNPALSCRVYSPSANIALVSPSITNGTMFTKMLDVYNSITDLTNSLPVGTAERNAADPHTPLLLDAYQKARSSFTVSTVIAQLDRFKLEAGDIITASTTLRAAGSAVDFYANLSTANIAKLDTVETNITNNCECTGGVCTTTVASKMRMNGAASFFYTITDQDGESDPKTVNLSIAANPPIAGYLKPSASSSYITGFNESNTSVASSYSVTIPVATDYFGSTISYSFSGTKDASNYGWTTLAKDKGKIYGCMDLVGSTGPTDRSCTYVPVNGDLNYTGPAPAKSSALIQGITFTAKAEGTYGDSISVQILDATSATPLIQAANFGLASSYEDAYVRVIDNAIQIYVSPNTTTTGVSQAILNDAKASSMVTATITTPGTFTTMPSATSLSGGVDAFDKISYTVSNNYTTSTNSASVIFNMTPVDDAPYMKAVGVVAFSSATGTEDGGAISVDLNGTYDDVDSFVNNCTIETTATINALEQSPFLSNFIYSCTCNPFDGTCSASVTPNANVSSTSPYYFYYKVTSNGLDSGYRKAVVNVTPVNDAPLLGAVAPQTVLENSTAAPSSGNVSVTVDPGGGGFETDQVLSLSLTSSVPTLVPSSTTSCTNYTIGTSSPIGSVTPASAGIYYYNSTAKACYVSTGTGSSSWALYPSLTAIPNCAYTSSGTVAPTSTPASSGLYYLRTSNNTCYKSSGTPLTWALDTTVTSYTIAYVPFPNKSGVTTVTMNLTDSGGGTNSATGTFNLTVTSVDDPPYFISSITKVDTNEGGMVVAGPFKVNEDEGDSADEDAQALSITALTSDNTNVLPTSAITIFYDLNDNGVEDSGESRALNATLEAAAASDGKLHNFYLKLNPVAGISGNANVSLTVNDGNVAVSHYITKTFSLVVHPIAALHGGWANITATGLKTDKNGAPAASADVQCNYNTSSDLNSCDGHGICSKTFSPNATIVPDAANVLFYDSAAKTCYRATTAGDKFSWVEFKTSCPVTRTTGVCSSENCISGSAPVPTAVGQYYYNSGSNTCFISTGTLAGNWIAYTPSKITLTWNSFNISGSGADATVTVAGWNVYRREKGYDYDYVNGFLKTNSTDTMTISSSTVKTFTDKTAVAGKVYYYLVRPVDSSTRHLTISTPEVYSEVRVLAPTENYSFVHRWMVNQEVCNSMHMTTSTTNKVDPTHNYRCPYKGPGESTVSPGYYDIEKDMLVDISESGCPYSSAPKCSPATGCVGIGDPNAGGVSGTADDIYYDRDAGMCYTYDGGTSTWVDYNSATLTSQIVDKTNTALNAPLTNISQAKASAICSARTSPIPMVTSAPLLPTKKEYIAYSAAPYGMSDSLITGLEQGFSLNVQSRCNSSNANGLDSAFSDSVIPSTSYIFTLPGTASSSIRSIYTGSVPFGVDASTESCSSRFGVQDVYGNVAEWVQDKISCNGTGVYSTTTTSAAGNLTVSATGTAHSAGATVTLVNNPTSTSTTADAFVGNTTITVTSTAAFGPSGTLAIGNEVVNFSTLDATHFTISALGAGHLSGSAVKELTAITSTTLLATANSGSTSLPLNSITSFPTFGYVIINSELITYSALTGPTILPVASTTGFSATGTITIGSDTKTYTSKTASSLILSSALSTSYASGTTVSLATNYVCASVTGTNFGNYDFANGGYNAAATNRYKFDLVVGPYNDVDASSTASSGDSFLTNWDFRDELFGAGKFSFPIGMPIYTDIGTTLSSSPALNYFLDIGPTSGITSSQLHEDGIIVNGDAVSNTLATNNPLNPNGYLPNPSQAGAFAQGGSYLSGNRSGRYTSELIPDANVGPDVGFRCYIPVDKTNYPADAGRHTYSY